MTTRTDARGVAVAALVRIDQGAYANLALPALLDASTLSGRDRALVTDLVYGVTRMRRACDFLVDAHLRGPVEPAVRAALRLGAYQLRFTRVPAHAAVSATVAAAPARARGLVNAVLRRVAEAGEPAWPSREVELSYPGWIVERLVEDLGADDAWAALERMNVAPPVTERADGYVQDLASQWVADRVGVAAGERVADLCAAPGGKTTAMAAAGAGLVVAGDVRPARAGLVAANAARLGAGNVAVMVADGTVPGLRPGSLDRVLVDAPCSGLGVLRRRPDARWRIDPDAPVRLAALARRLLAAAAALVRPGGQLTYSVCTLTRAETVDVDRWAEAELAGFEAVAPPGPPWRPHGRGALLLPQSADTDGMFLLGLRRGPGGHQPDR
ncbi:MAG TPA: transcription antitermination factor NusB [Acidimicrobiales bacterium]|nr:transcription antitermination factor NusB [Acidimicrobiales bacterium]